jgi:hypothetical protein
MSTKLHIYYVLTIRENTQNGKCAIIANKMDAKTNKLISKQAIEKNIVSRHEAENNIFILERTTFKNKLKQE